MPKFYIMFAWRKYFRDFWGCSGGGQPSCTPSPTPMAGPQAPHQLNPALWPYNTIRHMAIIQFMLTSICRPTWAYILWHMATVTVTPAAAQDNKLSVCQSDGHDGWYIDYSDRHNIGLYFLEAHLSTLFIIHCSAFITTRKYYGYNALRQLVG